MRSGRTAAGLVVVVALQLAATAASAATLQVVSTSPARNTFAPAGTTVAITFDQAVLPASITGASFRVFGRATGPASGAITFSNGNQTLTLTPSRPFSAGETVV